MPTCIVRAAAKLFSCREKCKKFNCKREIDNRAECVAIQFTSKSESSEFFITTWRREICIFQSTKASQSSRPPPPPSMNDEKLLLTKNRIYAHVFITCVITESEKEIFNLISKREECAHQGRTQATWENFVDFAQFLSFSPTFPLSRRSISLSWNGGNAAKFFSTFLLALSLRRKIKISRSFQFRRDFHEKRFALRVC